MPSSNMVLKRDTPCLVVAILKACCFFGFDSFANR